VWAEFEHRPAISVLPQCRSLAFGCTSADRFATGETNPTWATIALLANALDVSLVELAQRWEKIMVAGRRPDSN
jgi:hypothetical protein